MSGDETIREIKERLREEGYTSETIGEVLREVNSSFLAEDASAVLRQTKEKAAQLESVLQGIYSALVAEPLLDLRIECDHQLAFAGRMDHLDVVLTKSHRFVIAFESRTEHPVTPEEAIRLGGLNKRAPKPEPAPRRVVVARIAIQPSRERRRFLDRLRDAEPLDISFEINRSVLESDALREQPATRFSDCLTFVDYTSDRYSYESYGTIVAAISDLPERIGTYLGRKREFLDRFDFS